MTGLWLLLLLGCYVMLMAAHGESRDITENAPSAPATKDAYDV